MGRKAVPEGAQVGFHSLLRHAAPFDLLQQHMVIVDPLAARGDLHPLIQTVEAQSVSGIRRVVHGVEGTLFAGIMGDKDEIGAVFLLKISPDQRLLLRLKVVGIADGAAVFFAHQPFCLVKANAGNPRHIRQIDVQQGKLPFVVPPQELHDPSQHAGLHCHHVLEAFDISHFKIQGGVFVQVPLGVVLLRPEHGGRLKHPVKHANHHLLVKLRALGQNGGPVKIIQLKNICAALRAFGADLGRMDLGEALLRQIFPEASHDSLLDPESGPFPDVSERNGPKVQAGLQRNVHFRLGNGNRQRRRRPGKHGNALQPQLNALRRLFRRRKDAAGLHRIRFLQLL